jgi:hypothetical protein
MADPTKKPIENKKKDELSDDELNTVTAGAIDAFLDFTRREPAVEPGTTKK